MCLCVHVTTYDVRREYAHTSSCSHTLLLAAAQACLCQTVLAQDPLGLPQLCTGERYERRSLQLVYPRAWCCIQPRLKQTPKNAPAAVPCRNPADLESRRQISPPSTGGPVQLRPRAKHHAQRQRRKLNGRPCVRSRAKRAESLADALNLTNHSY